MKIKLFPLLNLALVGLFVGSFFACKPNADPAGDLLVTGIISSPDTIYVTDYSKYVDTIKKDIVISFNKNLDPGTISKSTVGFYNSDDNIALDFSLAASGNTITISPAKNLKADRNHTISLLYGIKAADGGRFSQRGISFGTVGLLKITKILDGAQRLDVKDNYNINLRDPKYTDGIDTNSFASWDFYFNRNVDTNTICNNSVKTANLYVSFNEVDANGANLNSIPFTMKLKNKTATKFTDFTLDNFGSSLKPASKYRLIFSNRIVGTNSKVRFLGDTLYIRTN